MNDLRRHEHRRPALRSSGTALPFLLLLFAMACGGGSVDGAQSAGSAGGADGAGSDGTAPAEVRQQVVDVSRLGFNEGDRETAVVEVIEFSDFGCGYCRLFHEETYPVLHEEFIASGQVVWKYIPILLGGFRNAPEVTLAAECAGAQGRFPVMRDILFRQQREWTRSSQPVELVDGYAREAELDMAAFAACLAEDPPVERLEMGNRAARQLGVRGTPTFFVSGQSVQGAVPLDIFQQVLREQIALRTPDAAR